MRIDLWDAAYVAILVGALGLLAALGAGCGGPEHTTPLEPGPAVPVVERDYAYWVEVRGPGDLEDLVTGLPAPGVVFELVDVWGSLGRYTAPQGLQCATFEEDGTPVPVTPCVGGRVVAELVPAGAPW